MERGGKRAPEVTLKGGFSCQADIRGKGVPDRGNSKHKGLERGSANRQEASEAAAE